MAGERYPNNRNFKIVIYKKIIEIYFNKNRKFLSTTETKELSDKKEHYLVWPGALTLC